MKKVIALLLCAVMLAGFAVVTHASAGTVVYANKTDKAPNLEQIDASWGEPSIVINKNSDNTELYTYINEHNIGIRISQNEYATYKDMGIVPEDHDVELYYLWDDKNLYFGMKTPDDVFCGHSNGWEGDGVQMWIQPLEAIPENQLKAGIQNSDRNTDNSFYESFAGMFDFYWTLDMDDYTATAAVKETGNAAVECEFHINTDTAGILQCTIAIPLRNIGLNPKNDLTGTELGTALLRVSSTQVYGTHAYAGWLAWGKYFYDTNVKGLNTIVLANGDVTPPETRDTTPADTTTPVAPNLDGVSSWAKTEVEKGITEGLVPENLQANYTSPVTRGAVAEMFIRLVEKITGKTAEELIAEKGYTIDEGKFTDTTDRNVILANALGIINGTSKDKFSPNGTLKRAQIAALINRVARVCGVETEGYTHDFIDITDNYAWVDAELGWPVHAGVINGVGGGKFNPGGDLTTEQAILITYRALEAIK